MMLFMGFLCQLKELEELLTNILHLLAILSPLKNKSYWLDTIFWLETDETTVLAKVFNSMDMASYLEWHTKQKFLESYGNEYVEKLMKVTMPDLTLGIIMSEWTDCKSLLSSTPELTVSVS